ncbi:hypothetical protein OEZ86_013133 [Tetradesmus obliquus]|nr:hypothetical protein OEZ86_013133 [Tetradesmus obliquus]
MLLSQNPNGGGIVVRRGNGTGGSALVTNRVTFQHIINTAVLSLDDVHASLTFAHTSFIGNINEDVGCSSELEDYYPHWHRKVYICQHNEALMQLGLTPAAGFTTQASGATFSGYTKFVDNIWGALMR